MMKNPDGSKLASEAAQPTEGSASLRDGMSDAVQSRLDGFLRQRLYVAIVRPTREVDAEFAQLLGEQLPGHWEWLLELEQQGKVFAAGPFLGDDGESYPGEGMLIFRASSLEEAREMAAGDPIIRVGLRTAEVRQWELNEGGFTVSVRYSNSRFELG